MTEMKIVVPIMPDSLAAAEALDSALYAQADIIEWRADFLTLSEIREVAPLIFEKFKNFQILFTLRTTREGGNLEVTNREYVTILQEMAAFEPAYLDFEYFSHQKFLSNLTELKNKLVLSYHNFYEMPMDLTKRLIQMWQQKTAFVKVAVMPQRECEVLDLLQITRDLNLEYGDNFITIAMGDLGRLSRISGYLTGNAWTFASLEASSAPGQISLADTRRILDVLES